MRDIFDYFEGGRDGVKRRFGKAIASALCTVPASDLIDLEHANGLQGGTFAAVARGDFGRIDAALIQAACISLRVSIEEGFGDLVEVTRADREALAAAAHEDEFLAVGSAGSSPVTPDEAIRLYVYLRALRDL